jgi:hypothetical protein
MGEAQPDRTREIPYQVEVLESTVNQLHDVCDRLISRLTPLMVPAPPGDSCDKKPAECTCPFAEKLRQVSVSIDIVSSKIGVAVRDLEL